ncbi:major facilitator superfamily domain-containing protein [Lipomyces doorenjongii]|uniref:major facilitator superfamily domain-containing protein n=1 Tax=Lipomyces doorenjongii TaxID=383834 RepID=UPI0034CEC0A3
MSSEELHNAEKLASIVSSGHSQSVESHILSEAQDKGEHLYSVTTTTSDVASLAASPLNKFYFWQYNGPSGVDLDAIATQPSVFDDPVKAKYYQPRADYENLHRFDPSARWTCREEIAVLRKIDRRIMLFTCIMFIALQLDRGNLSQALADNLLNDLRLSTNDYNNGDTIFTVCFLLSELPSQLVSKKLGPDRWVPMQMCIWSVVAFSQFWLKGRSTFFATRALLGIFEGGFIADITLYLSYFYTGSELPVRLGYFWASLTAASIMASFMGFGLLHMRGVEGIAGWRWLFLIEGLLTFIAGLFAFGLMPPSPTKTASRFRGRKGWFTPREETIMVNRVLRDDPSKGDMHNRQPVNWQNLWYSLSDYDVWPIYIIGITFGLSAAPVGRYLTLTLRSLGFSSFQSTIMGLPSSVAGVINMLLFTYLSQRYNQRAIMGFLAQVWIFPTLIALESFGVHTNRWSKYATTIVLLSHPSTHAVHVAWTSQNSNSVRTRTVASALYNISVQISGIIGNYIYRADDQPLYKRGNKVLIGLCCMNMVIYLLVKVYYVMRNRHRDKIWNAMTQQEKEHYMNTTTDRGNKRLEFRFVH